MASEDEGRTHSAKIDQCSLMQREANYHESTGLEEALDAVSEYDPLVPNR